MNLTKYIHIHQSLHVIWIFIIHISTSNNALENFDSFVTEHMLKRDGAADSAPSTTDFATTINDMEWFHNTDSSSSDEHPTSTQTIHCGSTSDNIDTNIYVSWRGHSRDSFENITTPTTTIANTITYSIEVLSESSSPILSYINHTSAYQQIFNPSWIPSSAKVSKSGILTQVQNCSLTPGECRQCNSSTGLVFTPCNAETGVCHPVDTSSGKLPYTASILSNDNQKESHHTSLSSDVDYYPNPSIFYWDDLYFMFVNKLQEKQTHESSSEEPFEESSRSDGKTNVLQLWTSDDPTNASKDTWNLRQSNKTFAMDISGPASLLPMNASDPNSPPHYLFFGGQGHISVTSSCSITSWMNINLKPWLQARSDHFDKDGVETGPAPIKMRDGNYLMLYNGYNLTAIDNLDINVTKHDADYPQMIKHYAIGWVILDGKDPTKILKRSDEPLITPTFDYQTGNAPYTCSQHNSVYAKGIVKLESSSNSTTDRETFRVYFSAADTSVGTAIINVNIHDMTTKETEFFTIAVIVSISCAIFVIAMFLIICSKNNKETQMLDLTTDAEYISIASAHVSKEISGTNHHGASYVIGSLDRKGSARLPSINSIHSNSRKTKRRRKDRKYQTNDIENLNHIHVHTTECYEEDDSRNCNVLTHDERALNTSLQSNISSSMSSSTSSNSTETTESPSTSSSSFCSHCHGKFHHHGSGRSETSRSKSKSETVRLSQISFRINETESSSIPSASSSGPHTTTIKGYNPKTTNFSFYTKETLGERLMRKY